LWIATPPTRQVEGERISPAGEMRGLFACWPSCAHVPDDLGDLLARIRVLWILRLDAAQAIQRALIHDAHQGRYGEIVEARSRINQRQ
jgi:hypothetical protein